MEYKHINYFGLSRKLPIVKTGSNIEIAGFNSVGDFEVLNTFSKVINIFLQNSPLFKGVEFIITTEVKGIPVAQKISELLNIPYICLRKEPKVYLGECVEFSSESITSGNSKYYISNEYYELLSTKDVLFVDDVYSTGKTFDAIIKFCEEFNCNLLGGIFILRECDNQHESKIDLFKHKRFMCVSTGYLPIGKSLITY